MLGSSSSLSPKEEVELRVLEGWVGLEVGKVLLGKAAGGSVGQDWAERARQELKDTEAGLGKGVSDWTNRIDACLSTRNGTDP